MIKGTRAIQYSVFNIQYSIFNDSEIILLTHRSSDGFVYWAARSNKTINFVGTAMIATCCSFAIPLLHFKQHSDTWLLIY